MQERHYARQENRTDQALTGAGIYLLERIVEDWEATTE
jgi:hypothetical protein